MAEEGVAALSLAEVARRMGIRPPSLYQYFPSRMAIYDALFGEGMRRANEVDLEATAGIDDPVTAIRVGTLAFSRWAHENPVLSQLLFWRTVPGFEPSPESYAPAVEQMERLRGQLHAAVEAGQLAPEAATDEGIDMFTSMVARIDSQQFANEPNAPTGEGRFTRLLPKMLELFFAHYAPKERGHDRTDGHRRRRT
jgi:AcrR family transcriptional regulator